MDEKRYCKCNDWKIMESQINSALHFGFIYGIKYDFKPFKFCPYCGTKLLVVEKE